VPEAMQDNLKTINSYSSAIEAEMAKSKLNASGIRAFISKDDCGGVDPAMQFGFGVSLQVRQEDVAQAMRILNFSAIEKNPLKFDLQKNKMALYSLLILVINAIGFGFIVAGYTVYMKILGLIFLIAGIAIWSVRRVLNKKIRSHT
jgi:hypothetical protein